MVISPTKIDESNAVHFSGSTKSSFQNIHNDSMHLSSLSKCQGGERSAWDTVKDYASTAWGYISWPFVQVYDWTRWLVLCCPNESTLAIVERLEESPVNLAKEIGEDEETFSDFVGTMFEALMKDPKGFLKKIGNDKKAFEKLTKTLFKEFEENTITNYLGLKKEIMEVLKAIPLNKTSGLKGEAKKIWDNLEKEFFPVLAKFYIAYCEETITTISSQLKDIKIDEKATKKQKQQIEFLQNLFSKELPELIKEIEKKPESFAIVVKNYDFKNFGSNLDFIKSLESVSTLKKLQLWKMFSNKDNQEALKLFQEDKLSELGIDVKISHKQLHEKSTQKAMKKEGSNLFEKFIPNVFTNETLQDVLTKKLKAFLKDKTSLENFVKWLPNAMTDVEKAEKNWAKPIKKTNK